MRGLQIAISMAQRGQRKEEIAGPLGYLAIARTPGTIGRTLPRGVLSILRDRQFEMTDPEQLQITVAKPATRISFEEKGCGKPQ